MRKFDDIIRQKLDALPASGTPDWDALAQQLDGDAFDAMLRERLPIASAAAAAPLAGAVPDWDAMSSKLDLEAASSGEAFDEMIANQLRNAGTADAPQASWSKLSHRMDTLWTVRRKIVKYRVLEAAAVIAILLTLAPLLWNDAAIDQEQIVISGNRDSESKQSTSFESTPIISTTAATSEAQANDLTDANTSQSAFAKTAHPNADVLEQAAPSSPLGLLNAAMHWLNDSPDNTNDSDRFDSNLNGLTSGTQGRVDQRISKQPSDVDLQQQLSDLKPSLLNPLGLTAEASIETDFAFTGQTLATSNLQELALSTGSLTIPVVALQTKVSKWGISANVGVQSWKVRTPRDVLFAQRARSVNTRSIQTGLSLTRALGARTQLSTGVELNQLNYDPQFPTVVQPGVYNIGPISLARAESFEGISLNMARIPLELRFNVLPAKSRAKIWLKAGVAGNFALNTEYNLRTTIADADRIQELSASPNANGAASARPAIVRSALPSASKPFVEGIFDGGVRETNSFMSGRIGLEAAFALNDRIDVFSGIDYSQFLPVTQGLGPNSDAFNAFGVTVGSRINL